MKRSAPLEIKVGRTYKNFRGYYRMVLSINEKEVTYEDGTGPPRTCKLYSLRQWVKKNYY